MADPTIIDCGPNAREGLMLAVAVILFDIKPPPGVTPAQALEQVRRIEPFVHRQIGQVADLCLNYAEERVRIVLGAAGRA